MIAHCSFFTKKLLVGGAFFVALLATGCANQPYITKINTDQLMIDSAFVAPPDLPDPNKVFELTAEQQKRLSKSIKKLSTDSASSQLIANVLHGDYSAFDYDNSYTRSASETYDLKQGNCLSMVIMTAAMSKYLGIKYIIQDVKSAPVWSRDGGLFLLNGHVNIRLDTTTGYNSNLQYAISDRYVTLDFVPNQDMRKISKKTINEQRLIAMYFVNLAADAMVRQQWDRAYYLLKSAIASDRYYSPAWNSLAVLYRRNDLLQLSENVYRYAMALNPDDMNLIANFSILLESQGRQAELFEFQRRYDLAQIRNPFHYFDQAEDAYHAQHYKLAIRLYKKALVYSNAVDEFYFGLFKSYYALGQVNRAKEYLQLAKRTSDTKNERLRYNAKLAILAKL